MCEFSTCINLLKIQLQIQFHWLNLQLILLKILPKIQLHISTGLTSDQLYYHSIIEGPN